LDYGTQSKFLLNKAYIVV